MRTLAQDGALRRELADNASRLADRYRWSDVVEPLRRLVTEPWRWESMRAFRATPVSLTEDAQLLLERRRHATTHALPASIEAVIAPMRRSSLKQYARTAWWHTPEPIRVRFRPLLRRIQTARRARMAA
jgi:hypothetical protein